MNLYFIIDYNSDIILEEFAGRMFMKVTTEEKGVKLKKNKSNGILHKIVAPKAPVVLRKPLPFKFYEWLVIVGISVFYAFFAFSNLGDTKSPQTSEEIPQNEALVFSVGDDKYINTLCWCYWEIPDVPFKLEVKLKTDSEWMHVEKFETENIFGCWNGYVLPYFVKCVRITHETTDVSIREMVLMDMNGNVIQPIEAGEYPALFDEQDTVPGDITHESSFYFDEMYYGPTAHDFINGLPPSERTHPPFGKILIALGVQIFGFTPFGIRFMGTLLGVLMLPFIYLLARNMTRNRGISTFVMFLFAFDFMHFTQTRIATIDVFVTFFIIIMYYFMERYLNLSFYDTSLMRTWIPLGCCGIAFGFGIASKWTGFYAGAGLAILFFCRLLGYYKEYRYALLAPDGMTGEISHKHIIDTFKKNTMKTIIFCIFFYIVIPFIIYLLSYIPFVDVNNPGLFDRMWTNQKFMLSYHSTADFYNERASRWYEWPLMIEPMRYFASKPGMIARQSINALGNPLVWWAGIPAFIYTLYLAVRKRKHEASFLCVAYLAQYLPWVFISRPTFIYHYFPSVPFITLMIGYCFLQIKNVAIKKKVLDDKSFYCLLIIYAALAYGLFQMFLPVISGELITIDYVDNYLSWLKSWDFVIR